MKLVQFINNRTEELMTEQEKIKSFSLAREAEADALKSVLFLARKILKFLMVFKVLTQYVAIHIFLVEEPGTPLRDKKIEENNKKLKKIGMKDLKMIHSEK